MRIGEVAGSDCERASKPHPDIPDYAERNSERLREKVICAARGEYTWQAGSFRKRTPARAKIRPGHDDDGIKSRFLR